MSCPATSTASATSGSSPAATAGRSSPSAGDCSICLLPSPPILRPTITICSSNSPGLPCFSARPAAEGACSSWGASSRASPRRRRTPHDHRSLGSTASTTKTLLSLIRDTCVLPHAAGSHPSTAPTPATLRISTNTSPLPVSTPQSAPHVPNEPPSQSGTDHAMPIAREVPAVQSNTFFGHRRQ